MRFEVSPQLIGEFQSEGSATIDELMSLESIEEGSFESRRDRFASDPSFKKAFFRLGHQPHCSRFDQITRAADRLRSALPRW